jgi:hypothetical protein
MPCLDVKQILGKFKNIILPKQKYDIGACREACGLIAGD